MTPLGRLEAAIQKLNAFADRIEVELGDDVAWRINCRQGLDGTRARFASCELLSAMVTDWSLVELPSEFIGGLATTMVWTEAHVGSLLFNMDSSIETFVFAANAVGNPIDPTHFRDVSDAVDVALVGPRDVLQPAKARIRKGKPPPYGHQRNFVSLAKHFREHAVLVTAIQAQHDVSKHRHSGVAGGRLRNDPPPEFLAKFGISADNKESLIQVAPFDELILRHDPKGIRKGRAPGKGIAETDLLRLAAQHRDFLPAAAEALAADLERLSIERRRV